MTTGRSLGQLVGDRLRRARLHTTPEYWNMKARAYSGLAASNWPSEGYNHQVHALQMQIIDRQLPEVRGWRVLDVGCGTGRTSVHLARRGAVVSGFDFAESALSVAERSLARLDVHGDLRLDTVLELDVPEWRGRFDALISLGCLTVACSTPAAFERALERLSVTLKPGGRALFIEPIHRFHLLRRVLSMSVREWVARCQGQGFRHLAGGSLCFVPARWALAHSTLPPRLMQSAFQLGERTLERLGFDRLGDYKWLHFVLTNST